MISTKAETPPLAALADEGRALERLVKAIVADEMVRATGRGDARAAAAGWTASTPFDEDGVGADSLMRLEIASRLDAVFHLNAVGVEDYLPLARTLGEWVELVGEGLRRGPGRITFRTSGSTGEPKPVTHDAEALATETRALLEVFGPARRIVALVPPQHLYGFLTTILAPVLEAVEVLDLSGAQPSAALSASRSGDRIVATPHLWDLALRGSARPAPQVTGVTSTAPCPPWLHRRAGERGLRRLVEIFGSTETGGLGWRDRPDRGFEPLAHLELVPGPPLSLRRRADSLELQALDALEPEGDGRFLPAGRLDGVVQVAGRNVDPGRVRQVLLDHPAVEDCAVRLDGVGPAARLKAFIVPSGDGARTASTDILAWCARRLLPAERPTRLAFGPQLPRNRLGKLVDWETASAD